MSNPTFLFMNPGSVVYTGSGSGFANLNEYVPSASWYSGTGGPQILQIDLGSSQKVTHVALGGVSLPASHRLAISGSNVKVESARQMSDGLFSWMSFTEMEDGKGNWTKVDGFMRSVGRTDCWGTCG